MRIIQLSDIHLSFDNINELRDYYLKKLIMELKKINQIKPINLIIITGDLVDKDGSSLKNIAEYKGMDKLTPFQIFEKEFIDPICNALILGKDKIILIPGNHDIDRNGIEGITEAGLISLLKDAESANKVYNQLKDSENYSDSINRLKAFKEFEQKYAELNYDQSKYSFSYFESTYVVEYLGNKVGFALINDCWRCSKDLKPDNHFIGFSQFYKCLNILESHDTILNIAVMHHPLKAINSIESEKIESILISQNYSMVMAGHFHKRYATILNNAGTDKCLYVQGRTAFDRPNEPNSDYQPGFNCIDIDFNPITIYGSFIKYSKNPPSFHIEHELFSSAPIEIKKTNPATTKFSKKDFYFPYDDQE